MQPWGRVKGCSQHEECEGNGASALLRETVEADEAKGTTLRPSSAVVGASRGQMYRPNLLSVDLSTLKCRRHAPDAGVGARHVHQGEY